MTGSAEAWIYDPNQDFSGSESFTFRVYDGTIFSDPATVDIRVNPINDTPVANPQTLSTSEDTDLPITLTGQDMDGDPITYRIVSQPGHGSLTGSGASRIYNPDLDYNGPNSFTFVVNDTHVDSSPATINITVEAVNDAPVAVGDTYQVNYE